jgi:hypothetical protein
VSFFKRLVILAAATAASWCTLATPPAQAQLIVLNRVVRVVNVDPTKGIIEVAPLDEPGRDSDVVVDTDTRMFMFDKQVPSFSWHLLRKGMKIRVQGGATWDVRVRAKKVFILGGEGNTP